MAGGGGEYKYRLLRHTSSEQLQPAVGRSLPVPTVSPSVGYSQHLTMLLSLVLSAALLASVAASYDNPSCPQPTAACTAGVQAAVQALQPPIGALQEQLSAVQRQLAGCDGGCPDGWSYHLQSNACYLVPDEKLDWWSALRSCVSLDPRAHLASLHAENNAFVTGLLQGKGDYVWVGLFVPNGIADLPWGWVDGTPLNFKNWLSPNPNNKDGVEGCGVICNWDGYPWNDDQCQYTYSYVCQINLH